MFNLIIRLVKIGLPVIIQKILNPSLPKKEEKKEEKPVERERKDRSGSEQ